VENLDFLKEDVTKPKGFVTSSLPYINLSYLYNLSGNTADARVFQNRTPQRTHLYQESCSALTDKEKG